MEKKFKETNQAKLILDAEIRTKESEHENESKECYENTMYLLKGEKNKAKLEHRHQRDEENMTF